MLSCDAYISCTFLTVNYSLQLWLFCCIRFMPTVTASNLYYWRSIESCVLKSSWQRLPHYLCLSLLWVVHQLARYDRASRRAEKQLLTPNIWSNRLYHLLRRNEQSEQSRTTVFSFWRSARQSPSIPNRFLVLASKYNVHWLYNTLAVFDSNRIQPYNQDVTQWLWVWTFWKKQGRFLYSGGSF